MAEHPRAPNVPAAAQPDHHFQMLSHAFDPPPVYEHNYESGVEDWKIFKIQLINFMKLTGLEQKPDDVRKAYLLTLLGKELMKVYVSLQIQETLSALDGYIYVIYERYVFNKAQQENAENFEKYCSRLRHLASSCELGGMHDELLRDRIVLGVSNKALRKKYLGDPALTLVKTFEQGKIFEATETQCNVLNTGKTKDTDEENHDVYKFSDGNSGDNKFHQRKKCNYCGNYHEWRKELCPAYGKSCGKCGLANHFAKVCKQGLNNANNNNKFRHTKFVSQEEDDDSCEENLWQIDSHRREARKKFLTVLNFLIADDIKELKCQLDTGAECNVLNYNDYKFLCGNEKLERSRMQLRCYGGKMLKPLGKKILTAIHNGQLYDLEFQVVDTNQPPLISAETCEQLNLIQIHAELCKINLEEPLTKEKLVESFNDVFTGLGCLSGKYNIEIDDSIVPVKSYPRRIPITMKEKLKQKLDELEADGVIKKETGPTEWISNLVLVNKGDKMRICMDPSELNKAIKRAHYQIPTLEELTPQLSKAKVFSVVDAKSGFWQVELTEPASKLTTFWTPFARYRWLRMPFGICSAPEVFQLKLLEVLQGLKGVLTIADDILVFGEGDSEEEALQDHNVNLLNLLQRAREVNLKLNLDKMKFRLPCVKYMGNLITKNGLKSDPSKTEALNDMKEPKNVIELQRYLGFVNYLSKYLTNLATIAEPLRQLTRQNTPWHWDRAQQEAFDKIKSMVTEAPVLKYYDVNKPVCIQCDSSDYGLGAVLIQDERPVAYASRTLTETERNYAQIEKEALSILFACQRFEQYIVGKEVKIFNDHQPLETIFKKSLFNSPKRLQRILLALQKYNISVSYLCGRKLILADFLSRAPLQKAKVQEYENVDIYLMREEDMLSTLEEINQVEGLDFKNITLDKIRKETNKDESLKHLSEIVIKGWPLHKEALKYHDVNEYWDYRGELSTENGIILRSDTILIPKSMRAEMLNRIHGAHQGIEQSTRKARASLFWPRMSHDIEQKVRNCSTCNSYPISPRHLPMQTHETPTLPWERVAADVFHLDGDNYLIVVDYYSDYFEIEKLNSLAAGQMILLMKKIFAIHVYLTF